MTPTRTEKSENFPVASWLLKPAARGPVLAFYRFARTADDMADGAAPAGERLAELDAQRGVLVTGSPGLRSGTTAIQPQHHAAVALAAIMADRGLDPVHARDLLDAFSRDVTTPRTPTYAELIAYCTKSAMPVGRFVLDVHGEDRSTWPASDALCAALQIVNHLQDCGKDFRAMDRVYIPDDMLSAAGLDATVLGLDRSPPALLGVIRELARRCADLLAQSRPFAAMLRDRRLAAEVRVIQRLAEDLTRQLMKRDPLAERIAHSKPRAAWLALGAVLTP